MDFFFFFFKGMRSPHLPMCGWNRPPWCHQHRALTTWAHWPPGMEFFMVISFPWAGACKAPSFLRDSPLCLGSIRPNAWSLDPSWAWESSLSVTKTRRASRSATHATALNHMHAAHFQLPFHLWPLRIFLTTFRLRYAFKRKFVFFSLKFVIFYPVLLGAF